MAGASLECDLLDCASQCCELERQELEAPGGVANGPTYLKLLAIYLLQNDLCNAKYLWKRIPQSIKSSTPELALVWNVGQKMWHRDFPGIYVSLNQEWTENVKPVMQLLCQFIRNRAMHLVSYAYSAISFEDFAAFVGMPADEATQAASQQGWEIDHVSNMIMPKKPDSLPSFAIPSEEQLMKLTEFVSFLEN